jgi:hypothetical protein
VPLVFYLQGERAELVVSTLPVVIMYFLSYNQIMKVMTAEAVKNGACESFDRQYRKVLRTGYASDTGE